MKKYVGLQWLLLALISTSVTVTNFHMHHSINWNDTGSQTTATHNISQDSNYCPYGTYLFGAKVIQATPHLAKISMVGHIITLSSEQRISPFYGEVNGRSPPLIG